MASLRMEHVYKRYQHGTFVLKDCNLELPQKEMIFLLGAADSGKTTLLKLLAGIENPSMGEIYLDDELIYNRMQDRSSIAMIFQSEGIGSAGALYPQKTVRENISFNLKKQKLSKTQVRERAEQAAEAMGVEEYLEDLPGVLSPFQRQSVMMAKAMAKQPKLILVDDPVSTDGSRMPMPVEDALFDKVRILYEDTDATVIYAKREVGEAWSLGQRAILLQDGEIIQVDELRNLHDHPEIAYTV